MQQAGPRRIHGIGHGFGVLHVTGANYSKRRQVNSAMNLVDGRLTATDDHAGRVKSDATGTLSKMKTGESGEQPEFRAERIDAHPILGSLPTVPIVTFTVDGMPIQGRAGEPIAAALFAANIRVLRTMPRFGDSRGGFCMIGRCTDCMVVVDGVPNVRACVTPIAPGLNVQTQRGLGEADWHQPGNRYP